MRLKNVTGARLQNGGKIMLVTEYQGWHGTLWQYLLCQPNARGIFSRATRLVTTLWNGVKEDIIEANEYLKAWFAQEGEH